MKQEITNVKKGTWLYDGKYPVTIYVFRTNISWGSGDYEDSEDIREDQYGEFYGSTYTTSLNEKHISDNQANSKTLEEEIAKIEAKFKGVVWDRE